MSLAPPTEPSESPPENGERSPGSRKKGSFARFGSGIRFFQLPTPETSEAKHLPSLK